MNELRPSKKLCNASQVIGELEVFYVIRLIIILRREGTWDLFFSIRECLTSIILCLMENKSIGTSGISTCEPSTSVEVGHDGLYGAYG